MNEKSEALRLAGELDACPTINYKAHAAELRRLHAENEAFGIHLSERMKDLARVEAQRDALLEALKALMADNTHLTLEGHLALAKQARAVIKAVEGETK